MMDKVSKAVRFLTPRITTYIVLSSTANRIVETAHQYSLPTEYDLDFITRSSKHSIEQSRPGYWHTARKYLDQGHKGFCICYRGTMAAMAWSYYNDDSILRHVTYYPLEPGRVWFHTDWVNPVFRNRGLHKILMYHRALYVSTYLGGGTIEANIDPGNNVSLHNFETLGFIRERMLYVLSLGGRHRCWHSPLNL